MLRLLRTARYLKPVQVSNRLVRRLRRPHPWGGSIPPVRVANSTWQNFAPVAASVVDAETVCFLNETGQADDWQNTAKSHLWLYNLHYFDDLNAQQSGDRREFHLALLRSWLDGNPVGHGVGWEPYPVSLRIVNWVKWLLAGNEPIDGMHESLFQQAHWLSQRLEYHLLGNHLLANGKALVFAGSYFEGDEADQWLALGLSILGEQHREQVLADGAHFELSPMYHGIILVDILDVIQLAKCCPGNVIEEALPVMWQQAASMAGWLEGMLHPDGDIPFFNDAAFGITPAPRVILDFARHLGIDAGVTDADVQRFEASGYVAVRQHDQVALMDVAAIGPDYLPGHAHADTLSFEWSLHGQRVLVNSGTSVYGVSEERLRQRATAAHNTVVVNGEDSSEVWKGFRVARRARPLDVRLMQEDGCTVLQAAHDGYKRLRPGVVHRREWRVCSGMLQVIDILEGSYRSAEAYYHFHPDVVVRRADGGINFSLPGGQSGLLEVEGADIQLLDGTWHPEFGKSVANRCLRLVMTDSQLTARFRY